MNETEKNQIEKIKRAKPEYVTKLKCWDCGEVDYVFHGFVFSCRMQEGICPECGKVIHWHPNFGEKSTTLDWSKGNIADQIPDCPDWLRQALSYKQTHLELEFEN